MGKIFDDTRDREAAAFESRNCQHCDGNGLVSVYHPEYQGNLSPVNHRASRIMDEDGEVRVVQEPFVAIVAAHCCCTLGRWMRERVEEHIQRRVPRVEDILAGRSKWLLKPHWEAQPEMPPTRASINLQFSRSTK